MTPGVVGSAGGAARLHSVDANDMTVTARGGWMLVMGLFAACGSDAAGASSEATAPDHDVADAADAVDIADGSAPGRLRATILMGGASPSWQPEALADTDEGWVLLVDLGAEPLTATRDGVVSTLEPGLAEVHRLALLPVAVDGTIGAPIEVARTAGTSPRAGSFGRGRICRT